MSGVMGVKEGFNGFLEELGVTFRRDPVNGRPRINKEGSVKDREQRERGEWYCFGDGGELKKDGKNTGDGDEEE